MFYYLISKYKDNEKRREESHNKINLLIKKLKIEQENYKVISLEKARLEYQDPELKNMEVVLEKITYNMEL